MKKKHGHNPSGESFEETEKLSPEEISMLRSEIANADIDRSTLPPHDTSKKANTLRFIKKNRTFVISIVAISILLVATLILVAWIIADINSGKPCTDDFEITLGKETYTLKYKDHMKNGIFYIDLRPIAKYAELTVSGSDKKIKFTASDNTYMQFEDGYDFAKVNGAFVKLGGVATVTADTCLIPFDFLSKSLVSGLLVKLDPETNKVNIQRKFYDTAHTQYSDILFTLEKFTVIEGNPYAPGAGSASTSSGVEPTYPIDVSSYLKYIKAEELILVNKTSSKLGADYVPNDLVSLGDLNIELATGRDFELQRNAAYALEAMLKAMVAEVPEAGDTYVTSAYRSYDYQLSTFEKYVKEHMAEGLSREEAEAKAATYSARPGESEHQTGLCVDLTTISVGGKLNENFENTPAFRWLSQNAHLYGFILRYPKDKTDVTGYDYEPWHYRFVGREAATEIYEMQGCLEDYIK